jgi:hypothetical protein
MFETSLVITKREKRRKTIAKIYSLRSEATTAAVQKTHISRWNTQARNKI